MASMRAEREPRACLATGFIPPTALRRRWRAITWLFKKGGAIYGQLHETRGSFLKPVFGCLSCHSGVGASPVAACRLNNSLHMSA